MPPLARREGLHAVCALLRSIDVAQADLGSAATTSTVNVSPSPTESNVTGPARALIH
jgi:hypothetical protein